MEKTLRETLRGGDTQNLVDSEASETEPGLQERRFIPQGAADSPFPGRGLPWSSRKGGHLSTWVHFLPSPNPSGQRMRQFTVCIYYCSRPPAGPPLPGKSLQAGRLAGTCCLPCGCQHHPLSLPGLLVVGQPLGTLALLPKAVGVHESHGTGSSGPWPITPALPGLRPWQGWRSA